MAIGFYKCDVYMLRFDNWGLVIGVVVGGVGMGMMKGKRGRKCSLERMYCGITAPKQVPEECDCNVF